MKIRVVRSEFAFFRRIQAHKARVAMHWACAQSGDWPQFLDQRGTASAHRDPLVAMSRFEMTFRL
jgi:hypothetical protein